MHKIYKVALAVIRNKKVLMTRERGSERLSTPGGCQEPGETDMQTLEREIREELNTGIDKKTLRFYGTFEDRATNEPGATVQIKLFIGELTGEAKPSGEVEELVWLGYEGRGRLGPCARNRIFPKLKEDGLI